MEWYMWEWRENEKWNLLPAKKSRKGHFWPEQRAAGPRDNYAFVRIICQATAHSLF